MKVPREQASSKKSIRGGMVGFGGIAKMHAYAYREVPGVKVVAVADLTPSRLLLAKEEFGIGRSHLYADYREMLDKESLDFVDVCVPHSQHREIVIAAAGRGINILCEKPLAISLKEADEMIEAARQNGVHLLTCHNWCYHPVFNALKSVIDQGTIGQILLVRLEASQRSGVWRGSVEDYLPQWRTMVDLSGGGALMDTGFHFCYLSRWLARSDAISVRSIIDKLQQTDYSVEDYSRSVFRSQNGSLFDICVTWFAQRNSLRSVLDGNDGSLSMPSPSSSTYATDTLLMQRGEETEKIGILREEKQGSATWQDDFLYSYKALLRDLVAFLGDGRPPKNPIMAEDAKSVLEMVLSSYESGATGEEIALPLSGSDSLYQKGVIGLRDLDVLMSGPVYQKNIFGVRE